MSNLIKYQFVNLDGKDAVLIDNNEENERFTPLKDQRVKIQTVSEMEAEKALRQANGVESTPTDENGFMPGISTTKFDEQFRERQREAELRANDLLEEAKREAERICSEAEIAVDMARTNGYEEGKRQGYQDGMAAAEQELQQREQEIADSARRQKEELEECISSIEYKYVDVLVSLLRKLTGVVLEEKEDLLLYLIQTTAGELEASNNFKIRVSPEDVYFLEARRAELLAVLGQGVNLEFIEEKGLEKGQCIIETDSQMVDCSFQTQLDTLIRDLRMLVH